MAAPVQAADLSETNVTMAVITLHVNGTYSPRVSSPFVAFSTRLFDVLQSKPLAVCVTARPL